MGGQWPSRPSRPTSPTRRAPATCSSRPTSGRTSPASDRGAAPSGDELRLAVARTRDRSSEGHHPARVRRPDGFLIARRSPDPRRMVGYGASPAAEHDAPTQRRCRATGWPDPKYADQIGWLPSRVRTPPYQSRTCRTGAVDQARPGRAACRRTGPSAKRGRRWRRRRGCAASRCGSRCCPPRSRPAPRSAPGSSAWSSPAAPAA